jgi:hypothetical protein
MPASAVIGYYRPEFSAFLDSIAAAAGGADGSDY